MKGTGWARSIVDDIAHKARGCNLDKCVPNLPVGNSVDMRVPERDTLVDGSTLSQR